MIIINCKFELENSTIENGYIEIENDQIVSFGQMSELNKVQPCLPECQQIVDANGKYVAPAFIDQHIHGAFGYDCMDICENPQAVTEIARRLPETGVKAFVPTIMTQSYEMMEQSAIKIANLMDNQNPEHAEILGINVEGPFINKFRNGAHIVEHIKNPDIDFITDLQDKCRGRIKLLTYAIELDPDFTFLKKLLELKIIPCCGHSNATPDQLKAAVANGLKCITHLNNAMPKVFSSDSAKLDINSLALASLNENVYIELICDGHHVDKRTVNYIYNNKCANKIILITDSTRAAGMSDGEYELGGQIFIKTDNACRLPDGRLAGSALQMPNAIKTFADLTSLNSMYVANLTTHNTATLLGVTDRYGSIAVGKRTPVLL